MYILDTSSATFPASAYAFSPLFDKLDIIIAYVPPATTINGKTASARRVSCHTVENPMTNPTTD